MARREFERARSLLPRVLGQLAADSGSARSLEPMWPELVGEAIGRVSRPVRLEAGVLVIQVTSPAWARELAQQEQTLLARIRESLGARAVRSVRFEVAGG